MSRKSTSRISRITTLRHNVQIRIQHSPAPSASERTRRLFWALVVLGAMIHAPVVPAAGTTGATVQFVPYTIDHEFEGACEVSVADMDGDGDLDMAGVGMVCDMIAWWENNGSQRFTRHTIDSSVGGWPRSVRVRDEEGNLLDLDEDGDVDVIAACYTGDRVYWYENDGSFGFTRHEVGVIDGAHTAVAQDVDRDGHLDIVCCGHPLVWFENDGSETFTAHHLTTDADLGQNVRALDLDGDSDIDILEARMEEIGPRIWWNNGSEQFTAELLDPDFDYCHFIEQHDVDGDGYDEIVTGPGPGTMFGPHIRGWNMDGGTAAAMPEVSFFAYGTNQYGVNVSCGDVDGDGIDEILTGPGPGAIFGPHVRGWNVDGSTVTPIPGLSFFAWPPEEHSYGVTVFSGRDITGDGFDEIVTGLGPHPANRGLVRTWRYRDNGVEQLFEIIAFPAPYTAGANVAAGKF